MAMLAIANSTQSTHSSRALSTAIFLSIALLFSCLPLSAEQLLPKDQGRFLVATDQLEHTPFQRAVILITHHSERGATGLTINRPSDIPLRKIFPHSQQLGQKDDSLYLGGPVSTNAIFVLLRTNHPSKNMHHIAKNIYFSTANNVFPISSHLSSRVYAGYAGWSPGQLQAEIDRGDWTLVHTKPSIIFEKNPQKLWHRLSKSWAGQWL